MRRILALISVTVLMVVLTAAPALAQQIGLVNVEIEDTTIQVPIGVAANLCDINVAVLVADFEDDGDAKCVATNETIATAGPGQGGGGQ